jgi:hypothetical protein
MSVVRLARRSVFGVCVFVLLMAFAGVPAAFAELPWFHLTSGLGPASIQPGSGRNEVQEITAGPGSVFALKVNGVEAGVFESAPYGGFGVTQATRENVQAALESVYGVGNVEVTGGPAGTAPLVVMSVGKDADMSVPPMTVARSFFGPVNVNVTRTARTDGEIVLTATNLGDAAANGEKSPISIVDRLPKGLAAVAIEHRDYNDGGSVGPVECSLEKLTCVVAAGHLPPYQEIEVLIAVTDTGASNGATNEASISGGGAQSVSVRRPLRIGGEPPGFGVEQYELAPEEEGGAPDTQAGSHPFQLTTTLTLNQNARAESVALAKDLHFKVPPGLIGNPTPFPRCTLEEFLAANLSNGVIGENDCPPQTAVGVASVNINVPGFGGLQTFAQPLFNLEPAFGEPARFGFQVGFGTPVILDTALRTGGDYGVTVNVSNISQQIGFVRNEVTFWGVPGDPRHDAQRGWGCIEVANGNRFHAPCVPLEAHNPPPLLELPTSCAGVPLKTEVEADSWLAPGVFSSSLNTEPMPTMDGCNRLPFTPSVRITPDGTAGSTPTGLTVDEHVPQDVSLNGTGLGEAAVKGLSVTLPEGVALNPAGADGLQACSMELIGLESAGAPGCPEAAKVATVKIRTPLLSEPLEGAAYLATQDTNPFGSLVAMYLDAENAAEGIRAKAAGEVLENPVTGQLTAHFEGDPVFEHDPAFAGEPEAQSLPELPFEDVEVHFFGGDRAPLGTPARCGSYTTTGTFTPWSGNPTTESSSTFDITSGPNGRSCADPLPFDPTLTAGTTSIQAGGFTPFEMTMSREDGEQSLQGIKLKMPVGMSGTLASVKLCGEAQADAGTCGPESEIGETIVSVGVGGDPYTVKGGKVYITGPYKGAPFGLSIVNPAKAGPFDLGDVVVRAKLEINEETAAITVTTDNEGPYKIPTIIDGIPLEIKHVNVDINRPGFTFNATNCSPLEITGSLTSTEGSSSALAVPYQATNCAVLAFKPKLEASTSGRTSRAAGASLHVKLGYPAGPYDANISRVKVELPKALPSRLTTLQKACTAAVFEANPAGCPAASIVGHATATTPVLPVPLSGPAYFVSHGGEAFPSLIIVLQGYGVTVHLVGSTFINEKTGITSSTFKTVPDVPVGTFELSLPEGPYSALAANGSLCKKSLAMPTEFIGQNGAEIHTSTKIAVTGCGKAKKKAAHHRKKGRKGKRFGKRVRKKK